MPPITISGINFNSTGLPNTSTEPSPIVSQTRTAKTANIPSATQNFRSKSASAPFTDHCPLFTVHGHGAQGRIRTSVARKERQIYSLLPLTARPPVPNSTSKSSHPSSARQRPKSAGIQNLSQSQLSLFPLPRTPQPPDILRNFAILRLKWILRGVEFRHLKTPARRSTLAAFRLPFRLLVELAKGFEPPTL